MAIKNNKSSKKGPQGLSDLNSQRGVKAAVLSLIDKFFKWIVMLIVIAVFALGYMLIIKDQYQELIKSKEVDLIEIENTIVGLQHAVNTTVQYVDRSIDFTNLEEELLSLALPNYLDFPSLMIQLESLAKETGFWVDVISINQPKTKIVDGSLSDSKLKRVNIDLVVIGGNYDKFKKFLFAMENSITIFDIVAIDFQDLGEGNYKYEMSMVTYYYPY